MEYMQCEVLETIVLEEAITLEIMTVTSQSPLDISTIIWATIYAITPTIILSI